MTALAFGVAAGLTAASLPASASTQATSAQATDPRPGPAILYAPPPRAPQLENAPGSQWHAAPILVSGVSAYRQGEFLYQDYLFDDLGAGGTYTYPTDPRYAKDAADLVEFRIKPQRSGLLVRLTYNAMIDPALAATTVALGDSATARPLPFDAGAREPAQVFLTVHGSTVEVTNAATGARVRSSARASVDLTRRQVTITVPSAVFDTRGRSTLRVASASGLWDATHDEYLQPVTGAATPTRPGNGGTAGGALFNVAFRYGETGEWRDADQAAALATGDLSSFHADVDLGELRSGRTDDLRGQPDGVPTSGQTDRIYASHFEDAQGRGPQLPLAYCHEPCVSGALAVPDYTSQLQPYSVYVPDKPAPPSGYGMTLNLHFCGGNYNDGPPDAAQLADRGTGSLVLTPEGRGGCFWYWSEAGADTFEAWADAGRHFHLDPTYNAISGWSMGGYGAYKYVAEFPDLFAAALPDIGCVSAETGWPGEPTPSISGEDAQILNLVPSFRNVPILSANANQDELCLTSSQLQVLNRFQALGYRYDWREYVGTHGPYYPTNDESARFLGNAHVDANPQHVTYVLDAAMQEPKWGLTANHAYWLSGMRVRDPSVANDLGTVDAFSHGFGLADPTVNPEQVTSGTSNAIPFTGQVRTWQQPRRVTPSRELDVNLTNIATVTIDPKRARLGCDADVHVTSDGPAVVTLAGCGRTVRVR
ncbi:MAG TPA: glucodextranase DOMON-like domain-containing protein [Pseudonocardiaceae bacterium]|nr:glucodextranase DOMON-like domain-containing protein [Pseudonocardiaceae bacterium]